MATTLDTKLIPKVYALLQTYGKGVTFTEYGDEEFDVDSGGVVQSDAAPHSVKAIPPYSVSYTYRNDDVPVGAMFTAIAAQNLTFTPIVKMEVTIDSVKWTISAVHPIYTGESVALYELMLTK